MADAAPIFWVVIPAAGVGRRMESSLPKQYLSVMGKTILEHVVTRFLSLSVVAGVVVVVSPEDTIWQTMALSSHPKVKTVMGGKERAHSVLNGLSALHDSLSENDWVLVHDAARPCIKPSDIFYLIERLKEHPVGGLLGLPQQETLKEVRSIYEHASGGLLANIHKTVDRSLVWIAQTPQMFRFGLLKEALTSAVASGKNVTDEAQAIELKALSAMMVVGSAENIKLTYPDQLKIIRFILSEQEES
jgi:2-C-methyl-D-erythritol 4-phosphate cytidylyltransferase